MAFSTFRPLRFGDCDPSGIAYFPSYLNILVGVLEEFFASIGADWPGLSTERRMGMPTVRLDLEFKSPGFHGDRLDFELTVERIGNASLDLAHKVTSGGRLLWTAKHRIVATSLETHKAVPWPQDLRARLTEHLETSHA